MNLVKSVVFIFLFSSCLSAMENAYTLDGCMYDLKSFIVSKQYKFNNYNLDESWVLKAQCARYRNLSFNMSNNQDQSWEKWLYDYSVMLSRDCFGSNIKIIFPNKKR